MTSMRRDPAAWPGSASAPIGRAAVTAGPRIEAVSARDDADA